MAKEKTCGIYCIENLVNHKKYIGQSVNIDKRWYAHRRTLNLNIHDNCFLQRAWNKYGENNFRFYIVKKCNIEQLDELEKYYIKMFNAFNNDYGYNMSEGGEGTFGYKHSEDTKKLISQIQIGKKLSEHHKEKLRQVWKDKINSGYTPKVSHLLELNKETQKPIDCYNINDGTYICSFDGIHIASKELNVEATNICKVLSCEYKHCNNYYFTYFNEIKLEPNEVILKSGKNPIYEVDKLGNIINLFPNASYCGEKLDLDPSSIVKVCKGKRNSVKGHMFKYAI